VKEIIITLFFFGGVILCGADGSWFPWINLVGLAMVAAVAYVVRGEI